MRAIVISLVCTFLIVLPSCHGEGANAAKAHHEAVVFRIDQSTSAGDDEMPLNGNAWHGDHIHQEIPGLQDVLVFYTLGSEYPLTTRGSLPREGTICAYDFKTGITSTARMPVDRRLMVNTEHNQPILLEMSYYGLNMHIPLDTQTLSYDDNGIAVLQN